MSSLAAWSAEDALTNEEIGVVATNEEVEGVLEGAVENNLSC
jgi:hypothetical protein